MEYTLVLALGVVIGYFVGSRANAPVKTERLNGIVFSEKLSKRLKL